MDMNQIRSLLGEVQIVVKKNREMLDRTEWNFNVFHLCGIGHYENWHSKILAEFLNPHGSHGLGDEFLHLFLAQQGIDFSVTPSCEVTTELSMDNGRMDIVIGDKEWVVVIENKVYAGEQEDQLTRYWAWAEKNYGEKNSRILYLTLDGKESETANDVPYKCVSYSEELLKWISGCVRIASERPFVRETLRQYRNHIKNLTGNNLEEEAMSELIKILSEPQNFEAAKQVWQYWSQARDAIAAKIIREAVAKLNGLCEIDEGSEWDFYANDSGVRIKILNTNVMLCVCSEHGRKSAYSDMYVGINSWDVDKKYFNAVRNAKKNASTGKDPKWFDVWNVNDNWVWKYLPEEYQDWADGEILLKCLQDEKFKHGLINSIVDRTKEIVEVVQQVK